jgi:23S rRNA A2030 N6-methylase RlmJ
MPWRQLHDPDNPENRNGGNGGDLGKHTVYLAVLEYLLAHSPWSAELRVRECHAGRGMYRIPTDDVRRPLLECLYSPLGADVGVLLHDVQRASQTALGVWPTTLASFEWYTGSAVVNAWQLGCASSGQHQLELYELAPETRAVLCAVFAAPGLQLPRVQVRILPDPENNANFDGEQHIEQNIAAWDTRDFVLLDPFAMWRQAQDQPRRNRYRRILDRLIQRGEESPSLMLFWTWGRAFPVADGDLDGTNDPVGNGYQELRNVLHQANRHFVRVTWRWGLQFAMWVLVPTPHLEALTAAIQLRCDELRDHLLHRGCGGRLANPDIQVAVD